MADAKMKVSQMGNVLITDDYDIMNVVTYNSQSQTYTSGKANVKVLKDYMIGDNDISALGDGTVTGAILNVKTASESADSNIAETMAQNGAHNLLPNTATSQVDNEVTFTVNNDKSVTVTVGSTTAADRTLSLYYSASNNHFVVGKKYKISGGANANIFVTVFIDGAIYGSSQGNVVEFTMPTVTSYMQVVVYVASGTIAQTVTVEPMITLASDPSTEYAPYAMTNRELTEKKSSIKSAIYSDGTTDQYGNITTNIAIDSMNIIGARLASALIGGVIPMISATSNTWFFKCVDFNNQPFANQSINVKYYYYE